MNSWEKGGANAPCAPLWLRPCQQSGVLISEEFEEQKAYPGEKDRVNARLARALVGTTRLYVDVRE